MLKNLHIFFFNEHPTKHGFHLWKSEPQKWEGSWISSAITDKQLRVIFEKNPLKTIQEVTEELNVDYSKVVQHSQEIIK